MAWIIPCSGGYNLDGAYRELESIDWRRHNYNFETGEDIYIYLTSPINAIYYKGVVTNPILFTPPLTKVQLFKLKKILTDSEQIFIIPIEGKDLNIEV